MADPTPYEIVYSFTGFQNNAPDTPLPAPALDAELLNIATAVSGVIAAITDIRRADGALKNGIVTFDSFEQGLQLLLDPTNGQLVAAAVATSAANAALTDIDRIAAAASAADALAQANAAAASAATVNLSLYLAKSNNLAELGSLATSRSNLGLGTAAVLNVGAGANNIVQLDSSAKLPAYDGSQLINIDTLPVGTTIWVNATSAPAGFLKENGVLLSRATYARLWTFVTLSSNAVSEAAWAGGWTGGFSTGDLSTTFRLPDSRGEFIRGYDDGRGVDSGRSIYDRQADSLKDHTHPETVATNAGNTGGGGAFGNSPAAGTTGSPSTGAAAETRPRNIAKLACIKY